MTSRIRQCLSRPKLHTIAAFSLFIAHTHMTQQKRLALACLGLFLWMGSAHAAAPPQTASALLKALLDSAEANNPDIKAARRQVQASAQDIDAVRWKRWPSASVVTESNTAQSGSASVRTNSMRIEQVVYDSGKISSQIQEYESARQSSVSQLDSKVLEIKIQIANIWQSLYASIRKKDIAEKQIQQLMNYDRKINNRITQGATPLIERELTASRLLQANIEKKSLDSNIENAVLKIQLLSGMSALRPQLTPEKMAILNRKALFRYEPPGDLEDTVAQHPAVLKAHNDKKTLDHRLKALQSDQVPQLYVRLDKPLQSSVQFPNASPSVYAGIRYSLEGGLSGLSNLQALGLRLMAAEEAVDSARLDVRQALETDILDLNANRAKIDDAARTIGSSQDVLQSYERQFQAGRKSWQDLLNALRELTQNEYALVDTEASVVGAMYRIQLRSSQPLTDLH